MLAYFPYRGRNAYFQKMFGFIGYVERAGR